MSPFIVNNNMNDSRVVAPWDLSSVESCSRRVVADY